MIIKSVCLKNIRSYLEQEIKFDAGISLLAGDIGAGKSTILLAIDFALFGLQRGELSGGALLRNGAEYGSVTLCFSIGENEYKIQRTLKKSGSGEDSGVAQDSGFISINSNIVKGTAIELKQKIISILNYPEASISKKSLIYRYTVYTPQEEMKAILTGDSEARLEALRKLFNIDKYKRILDNSKVVVSRLREKKKELNAKIYDLDDKKKKFSELNGKVTGLQDVFLESENNFMQSKNDFDGKREKNLVVEEKVKKFHELIRNKEIFNNEIRNRNDFLMRLNNEIAVLKNEILNFGEFSEEDFDRIYNEFKNLKSDLKQKEDEIQSYRKLIVENETNRKNVSEFLIRLSNENLVLENEIAGFGDVFIEDSGLILENIKNLESSLRVKEEELQSSRKIIIENETRKKHQEHLNGQILSLENCPTCKQNVSVEHKISMQRESLTSINKFDENISKAAVFEKEIDSAIILLKKEIDAVKTRFKDNEFKKIQKQEFDKKKLRHDKLSIEIENNDKKLKELNAFKIEIDEGVLISEIALLREKLKEVEFNKIRKEEFFRKKKKHEGLEIEMQNCSLKLQELNELKFKTDSEIQEMIGVEEEFVNSKKELDESRKQMQEYELKMVSLRKDIEFLNKEISDLSEEIGLKDKIRIKLDEYSKVHSFLDSEFLSMVEMMERKVMSRVHFEFNSLFSKWLGTMLNSEITNGVLNNEFTPVITQNGYDIDYSNLSGGEKTACALAYRLALNQVVNSIESSIKTKDLIILDEPTDGFSPEQLEILKDVLNQLNVAQVIIVSHEPKIESFASHIIRIEKNESHVSNVNYY